MAVCPCRFGFVNRAVFRPIVPVSAQFLDDILTSRFGPDGGTSYLLTNHALDNDKALIEIRMAAGGFSAIVTRGDVIVIRHDGL